MDQTEDRRAITPQTRRLIEALISECRHPVRLLELYYWSTDPELLPIIRGFALMPNETRAALEIFVRDNNPNSIGAEIEANGQIRLMAKRGRLAQAPSTSPSSSRMAG